MSGMSGKNWVIRAPGNNSNNNNNNGRRYIDPSVFNAPVPNRVVNFNPNNNNNNAGLGAINTTLFTGNANANRNRNRNNNGNNNFNNNNFNAANNDDELGDLLMTAELLIDQFDQSGNVNYQDLSDVIHDLGVSQAFDERAVNGSHEMNVWNRLNEIRNQLAPGFHARAAPAVQVQAFPAAVAPGNIYSPIQNVGRRTLPTGSENVVSRNNIRQNNAMVNFHGESGYGRYYKRNTFNSLPTNAQGEKQNPATRAPIRAQNVVTYTANIAEEGGKRRKSRKTRKTRKSRRANTRK